MSQHDHDPGRDPRDDEPSTHGPRENTDDATKADAGMTGTPAQSYSPEGMAPADEDEDEDVDDEE